MKYGNDYEEGYLENAHIKFDCIEAAVILDETTYL